MVEKRRKPGRPAYGSREKLIAATCALLAERGFEATSPTMILKRSGVGHGSMYHYFEGKEDLAVAAMDHLRTRTFAILRTASEEAASDDDAAEDSDSTPADMDAALDLLFARQAGQALLRLLADPTVAGSVALSKAVQEWCYEVRAVVFVALNGGESDDTPSAALDGLHGVGDPLLTAALGRGLLGLPRLSPVSRLAETR